jgi:hypothetical protein
VLQVVRLGNLTKDGTTDVFQTKEKWSAFELLYHPIADYSCGTPSHNPNLAGPM